MNVKLGCGEISWLKQLMLEVRNTHTWLKISIRCSTGQKPISSVQFSVRLCSTLCDLMDCSAPGLPVHHQPQEFAQTHVHWGGDAIQQTHPLSPLLLLSIFPSIRVFSKESALCIMWPKHWSFSLNPSNEYSGLIFLRIDWFYLAV